MEGVGVNTSFFKNKKIFITGHTGFKGSWLCLWLYKLGAQVTGYALTPPTNPNMFELCNISEFVRSIIADIRDRNTLTQAMNEAKPDIVIHMAAQPLVKYSYQNPVETYEVNVLGTVNLFEAVRKCPSVKASINVTTDKCYENREWYWGYREYEPLGGYDPYSSSKACSELVTTAYRNSFFNQSNTVYVSSARAGNVIGGGDWAVDRLIPDCIKAILNGETIIIRNPYSIRPWQHVLEPLSGYLMLAECLYTKGANYAEAWNFGPNDDDAKPVEWLVKRFCDKWGNKASYAVDNSTHPHEAHYLKLDCSKAKARLGWKPRWNLDRAIDSIIEWLKAYIDKQDLREVTFKQIEEYSACN